MRYLFQYIYITILLYSYVVPTAAQTVGYTHKALTADGCSMKYSITKQDSSYYVIATVRSERLNFLSEPTMKIRTFNDDVVSLKGVVIGSGSHSVGIVSGGVVIPVTQITSTAQFSITSKEIEMLNKGVAKIRLSMTPNDHERTFKKDKIGKKLYQLYLKAKTKEDDF